MEDFLKFIVDSLVSKKDEVKITQQEKGDGSLILTLKVAKDDIGKIIGKGGKTIRAIRTLLTTRAIKEDTRVYLQLIE